jgi:hypothetical protein
MRGELLLIVIGIMRLRAVLVAKTVTSQTKTHGPPPWKPLPLPPLPLPAFAEGTAELGGVIDKATLVALLISQWPMAWRVSSQICC